jgi:hypothetical protein
MLLAMEQVACESLDSSTRGHAYKP